MSTGGTGDSAGTGVVPTAGTGAAMGGTDSGQAGSQASAGTGGMAGPSGGMGGSASGGTGGGSGGASGGSGGGGGSGGAGDAGKIMLSFADWYPRNSGPNSPNPWTNNADGTMTVKNGGGDILTKQAFQNVFVHVEYMAPDHTYKTMEPQERGNSGVYLKGSYELQVLDTFSLSKTANDYCGAIYKIAAPLVSACKTGGQWNVYEIEFQANVCTNGMKTTSAKFVEVKLNGTVIHQNVVAGMTTQAGLPETCEPRGVMLQDHSTEVPVSFRNIWVIPRN